MRIPANTELYMDEFRNLIAFEALNPETITTTIGVNFSIKGMLGLMDGERMTGAEDSTGMKNSSFSANVATYLSLLGAFICLVMILVLCIVFQGFVKKYIMMYLAFLKKKTFFGGFIKGNTITYLKVNVACVVYFRTLDMAMFNEHWKLLLPKLSPAFLVLGWPFVVCIFLSFCKKHLGKPEIRGKFGQGYLAVDLKRGNWAIAKYPIYLIRRFLFVMIPVVYKQYPWH